MERPSPSHRPSLNERFQERFPEPRVKIEDLEDEQKARVEQLEKGTDKMYELRTQLASFFRKYRRPLLKSLGFLEKGSVKKSLLAVMDGLLAGQTAGDSIEDQLNIYPDEFANDYLDKLELVGAVERALEVYSELKPLSWNHSVTPDGSDAPEIDRFYQMRFKELGQAAWIRTEMQEDARRLEGVREKALNQRAHPSIIQKIDEKIIDLQTRAKEFFENRPEAWILSHALRLKEMKETYDSRGRIVETPYVKEKMQHILEELQIGRPVFIVGELGSGKTELARQVAYKTLSEPHVRRWEAEHPRPEEDSPEYTQWLAERESQREAIVVSGHRALEAETLFASREVKRKETLPPSEQVSFIADAWQEHLRRPEVKKAGLRGKDLERERDLFEKGYLELFRSPIETGTVLGGLLRAMKEGRPFILDEINAVPHHVLISVNDLLMRKPGDLVQVPVPGSQPFRVQEGFSFIGTGNYKPEDGNRYVGRQQMDAAFLSRLAHVSYDYLPMSEATGTMDEPKKNELFHMVIARLIDKDLTVEAPRNAFEQIKGMCRVARLLQNVISDRQIDSSFFAKVNGKEVHPKDVLKENVLSIRHLLPVIDAWKASGYSRDLNDILFDKYVSKSEQRPQEKIYIYRQLQVIGQLFPTGAGWPDSLVEPEKVLTYRDPAQRLRGRDSYTDTPTRNTESLDLVHYSTKELVKTLFGEIPQRKEIHQSVFKKEQKEEGDEMSESLRLALLETLPKIEAITAELEAKGIDPFAIAFAS